MTLSEITQGAEVLPRRFFRQGVATARLPFEPILVPDHDSISPEVHDPLFLIVNQSLFHGSGVHTHLEREEVIRE
jgi:hypothetical protein